MFRWSLVAMVGMLSVAAEDFTEYGPYVGTTKIYGHTMPSSTGCSGWDCNIKVTVTKPDGHAAEEDLFEREAPFPVIFMFNAFQSYASYYRHYVEHLVSFGYVIVQYDTKKLCILTDKTEAAYFPHLLEWVKGLNEESGGFLSGLVDFDRVGVAGHSRGGKLAALHTARMDIVKAAYLIDPVDNDGHFAKESEDYPSAAKALVGRNKRIGVVGSGITGRCNPDGANYKEFWGALGHGSWLTVIQSAGHCQYISAPPLFEWAMGVLCGHGGGSCEEVITVTRPGMAAWFEKSFRGLSTQKANSLMSQNGGLLDAFFDWVEHMEEKQVLDFDVKGQQKPFGGEKYFPQT
ncbi:hypothetical protein BSKO_04224 [Bryopsis sp. KO-2023]|nr:hypothetical protein BSKO_04224 [Bryopsis sp. KO-2023]